LIVVAANQPTGQMIRFFDDLFPGIWQLWVGAAEFALSQIDAEGFGNTTVTSWFRSPSDNRRVRGDPDSQHLVGLALDVVPARGISRTSLNEAAQRFREAGFVAIPKDDHVHVQTFPAGVLRQVGILDALGLPQIGIEV